MELELRHYANEKIKPVKVNIHQNVGVGGPSAVVITFGDGLRDALFLELDEDGNPRVYVYDDPDRDDPTQKIIFKGYDKPLPPEESAT